MCCCVELYTATQTSVGEARLPLREVGGGQAAACCMAGRAMLAQQLPAAAPRHPRDAASVHSFVIRRVSEMAAFLISILCTFCLKS